MANPDDPDYDAFILGALNASMSSAYHDIDDDDDVSDVILNNISDDNSDSNSDFGSGKLHTGTLQNQNNQPGTGRPTWVNVSDCDTGPTKQIPLYNVNGGPVLPEHFDGDTKPIEFFQLFFNNDIISFICNETNIFANKRKEKTQSPHARVNKWQDINDTDLNAFLGTIINMGLMPLSSLEEYFTLDWMSRIPFYGDVFSKNEFMNIFWNLHFSHDQGQGDAKPKGYLIKPVVDHIKSMCALFYNTSKYVSVDESTISFKGKVSFRIYNPQKPTKFGIKIFVISDSTNGYIYNFIPYYGKQELIPNSTLLKTTQIVKVLSDSVLLKDPSSRSQGLQVYTDRYYTSPELANELLNSGCALTGTVMPNRVGMPKNLKTICKTMKKGDIQSQRQGNLLVVSWRDKRVVHMLSTKGKGSKSDVTQVQSKWPNKPPTNKPDVVVDYTKHMGGVDRSDHFISSYQFMRRTKKWYRKIFFWLLEVALVNSYLLYKIVQVKCGNKPLSHKDYRKSLVTDLVAEKMSQRICRRRRGRPIQCAPQQIQQHFLGKRDKGSLRCVVCTKNGLRKESMYYCKTCPSKPPLHPDSCFEIYHTTNGSNN